MREISNFSVWQYYRGVEMVADLSSRFSISFMYPQINHQRIKGRKFGGVGDGVTSNTDAFRKAIGYLKRFENKGGSQLNVPQGRWVTGSFNLTSNFTLFLEKGAVILGSQHIALECTTKSLCWNYREPGHTASNCPNEDICHRCGKGGHQARDCHVPPPPPGDVRLCNSCYKQGHLAPDCTNEKACNNCRRTGHLARDCTNELVCNLCNLSGHVTRGFPKADDLAGRGSVVRGGGGGGYRDVVCRNCQQLGHMSRDCVTPVICNMCGGRGHLAYECPSGRYLDRYPRRY